MAVRGESIFAKVVRASWWQGDRDVAARRRVKYHSRGDKDIAVGARASPQ